MPQSNHSLYSPRYWPTRLGLWLLRLLSYLPLPILATVGYVIGFVFYLLAVPRRRIAQKNIDACFPELSKAQRRKINLWHFLFLGQSILTAGMNWWVSTKRFNRLVTIKGREHYDRAIDEGRNVILLAPHFIALEVAGLYLSQERPMITMYQYAKNQLVNETVKKGRGRFGGVLVERKEPMRNLIRLTRKGYPFYYLPDQDAGRKGIFVPFFHEQAATIPMLGKFSSMTNAVVIPCSNRIKPWGLGYEAVLGAPLENFPCGDDELDTIQMNRSVESMIREMPEQYFWVHKRFKTRPQGEKNFYN